MLFSSSSAQLSVYFLFFLSSYMYFGCLVSPILESFSKKLLFIWEIEYSFLSKIIR